ncbi:MAG TPA: XTP/dITP diphosphatase [Geobacterales bacterium]|nr:XTP/dITP diphosphatase [Geobacterales bacterium]
MKKVTLITGNTNKFKEMSLILIEYGIELEMLDLDLFEIQSEKIEEIALNYARNAYKEIRKPLIVEDSGLFIKALNGFPGPYSSYVNKTIGNEGILRLMYDEKERTATFKAVIVYKDDKFEETFVGEIKGEISREIRGNGWGFDPIFIPNNSKKTFGEMQSEEKNKYSHRGIATLKFAQWYSKLGNQSSL